MALRAVPDHPKFADLKAILKQPKGPVAGWLEMIWHFTGRFTPRGNIGKYNDAAIEAWVEWNGEPGSLIAALIKSEWLDRDSEHRLLVHDWSEHADKATKNALKRANLDFCTYSVRTPDLKVSTPSRLPVPVPTSEPVPVPVSVPEANTKTTAPRAALGYRLPETFSVTEEHRRFAIEKSYISPDAIIDEFRDYWVGVPGARGQKLDWDATFRNRMREKTKPNGSSNGNVRYEPGVLRSTVVPGEPLTDAEINEVRTRIAKKEKNHVRA